jgi:hypothetical protein
LNPRYFAFIAFLLAPFCWNQTQNPLSERLGPEHNRAAFRCESEPLERYLKDRANQDLRRDLAVTYVLTPAGDRTHIAGYYTLSADTIPIEDLSQELVKKLRLPHSKIIPTTLIGRLARDLSYKGHRIGQLLVRGNVGVGARAKNAIKAETHLGCLNLARIGRAYSG